MAAAMEVVIDVVPTGDVIGAEIKGVDLSAPLSDKVIAAIRSAWLDHHVVYFRNQNLTDAQLVAFGRRFGTLQPVEFQALEYNRDGLLPEIDVVSNVIVDGKPIGCGGAGELGWHTDMSIFDLPASATFLYAAEVPPSGTSTRFSNMIAAYEALPQSLKDKIEGRRSIHDIAYTASGTVRGGFQPIADKSKGPGAVHPVVRTHPETGQKALFLGRRGYGYIHGYPVPESDALLDVLWDHMTNPRFIWEHHWRRGDVIGWDNRCLIHGRGAFDPQSRRIMRRITVEGDKPF
jgi:taurine dioxygenase